MVGGIQQTAMQKFPTAELGTSYRYSSPDFRGDVFVYPHKGWPDITRQANDFPQTLEVYRSRGEFDSYQILLTQPITVAGFSGQEVVHKYTRRGQVSDSYFSVVELPNEYVKFRISQPPDAKSVGKARDFMNSWVAAYLGVPGK